MVVLKSKPSKKSNPSKQSAERRFLKMIKGIGAKRRTSVYDLGSGARHFTKGIRLYDSIVINADRSEFEIVFMGVDKSGRLDCRTFKNRAEEGRHFLRVDEEEKVWGGMLKSGHIFSIVIKRIELNQSDPSFIAKIDLHFKISKGSVFST
jgi:hypothetical protein